MSFVLVFIIAVVSKIWYDWNLWDFFFGEYKDVDSA